jgi:hypothetical protein
MKILLALTTLLANRSMVATQVSTFNISCGQDTFLDENVCQCDRSAACTNAAADNSTIFLAGLLDTDTHPWVEEIFGFVFRLINNHSDGWFDDLLDDGTVADYEIANS